MDRRSFLIFIIALLFLVGCTNSETPVAVSSPSASTRPIVLGLVSADEAAARSSLQPLANYLAENLASDGITDGEVWVASSVDEMAGWLRDGKVDLYFDGVYPAAWVCKYSGATLFLRSWQFAGPENLSVIFASRSSGISSLADLRGNLIVFDSAGSTTGFLLPASYLLENGLTLSGKSSYDAEISPSEVGFMFSGSDENTLQMVMSGYAEAGAVSDYYFDVAFPPEAVQKLVVLGRTETVARQVVVLRPGLDDSLRGVLEQAMLGMEGSEAGKAALAAFQSTRFDKFVGGTETAAYRTQQMLQEVEGVTLP